MTGKELGKITKARYGLGGSHDSQFGLSLEFASGNSCVATFIGAWADYPPFAKYSAEEWRESHADSTIQIKEIFAQAKVDDVSKLVGKPVELTFEGNILRDWRILTEVL